MRFYETYCTLFDVSSSHSKRKVDRLLLSPSDATMILQ